jgi:hypothetical protein
MQNLDLKFITGIRIDHVGERFRTCLVIKINTLSSTNFSDERDGEKHLVMDILSAL